MLEMVILVFTFMSLIILAMAVGVLFGRKPISGSCGGMAAIGMASECDVCGGDKSKCDSTTKPFRKSSVSAYNAAK